MFDSWSHAFTWKSRLLTQRMHGNTVQHGDVNCCMATYWAMIDVWTFCGALSTSTLCGKHHSGKKNTSILDEFANRAIKYYVAMDKHTISVLMPSNCGSPRQEAEMPSPVFDSYKITKAIPAVTNLFANCKSNNANVAVANITHQIGFHRYARLIFLLNMGWIRDIYHSTFCFSVTVHGSVTSNLGRSQ